MNKKELVDCLKSIKDLVEFAEKHNWEEECSREILECVKKSISFAENNKPMLDAEDGYDKIQIKVSSPKGERVVEYKKVSIDYEDENLCMTKCPYGGDCGKCDKLRDPRNPENKNACFITFCQEIDSSIDLVIPDLQRKICMNFYVPVEGTLEKNLGDIIMKD